MQIKEEELLPIKKKIKLREETPENLLSAIQDLLELSKRFPNSAVIYGLLAEIYYWIGEEPELYNMDKHTIYHLGSEYGKKGAFLDENNIESNFWLAVNYGRLGLEKGMMTSFFLLDPIEKHFQKALRIQEDYFYGAPHRAYGWFLFQIPPWPIAKGDKQKAFKHLEKALEFGPEFYLNHIYLIYIFLDRKDKTNAKKHIDWVLGAQLHPHHEREETR
jgi:tetratricopeptide (TPR) repeat protein